MSERKIKYTTVSISVPLMKEIKEHISKNNHYLSVGEFVRNIIYKEMEK